MADLYKGNPTNYGGFTTPIPGGSTNRGIYQQPFNLPFTTGRSILATIPEYQRNPLLLEKDIMFKIQEGRNNFMKILFEQSELDGGLEVNDVRFRLPIEIEPQQKIYLAIQGSVGTTKTINVKIKSNQTPISTAHPKGNIKQVGDIARIEPGQFLLAMFSWNTPGRTTDVSYAPNGLSNKPIPEIWKVISVDYKKSIVTVERNWAGEQRTTEPSTYSAFSVVAKASKDWATGAIPEEYAFLLPMAKSMKEDEIDSKIRNFSGTWAYGILQRDLRAWGSQYFAEVISANMGIESPGLQSKRLALKEFYDNWEWTSIFGEKSESFDPETGYWMGTTDGFLANVPKSHYWALKGINYSAGFTSGSSANFGSFHPSIFNKVMQNKAYHGSEKKVLVCGSDFYTDFTTMINFMTQAVPDIKSDWKVEGKQFKTSDGLTIDVIPSDKMTLNGMSNSALLVDKQYFKVLKLKNYPSADIYEIQNENPLKNNGFIHGVKGFIDLYPDAHWVFTLIQPTYIDGTSNSTVYNALDPLGQPLA